MDIRKVQDLLGHRHITHYQIYDKRRRSTASIKRLNGFVLMLPLFRCVRDSSDAYCSQSADEEDSHDSNG